MEFASSAAAALATLAKTPADVIVSDMRMPGMDGWQLLGAARRILGPLRTREAELLAKLKLTDCWPEWLAAPDSFDFVESAA